MNAKKIIIDCDPGIDDALAIILAIKSKEVDLQGITTVCGNVNAVQGAINALKILQWMNISDIPVYIGEEKPLYKEYKGDRLVHGKKGLGDMDFPDLENPNLRRGGVEFIRDTLEEAIKRGEKISIIAIGPLTNIAKVIEKYPEVLFGLDQIISMGGSFNSPGNRTSVAEFNYYCDPDAAKIVYEAFSEIDSLTDKYIHMIGLNVTRQIILLPEVLEYMKKLDPKMGNGIEKLTNFYRDSQKVEDVCILHDPLALAYYLKNSIGQGGLYHTRIVNCGESVGRSIVEDDHKTGKRRNSFVLEEVSPFMFFDLFIDKVFKSDKEERVKFLESIYREEN